MNGLYFGVFDLTCLRYTAAALEQVRLGWASRRAEPAKPNDPILGFGAVREQPDGVVLGVCPEDKFSSGCTLILVWYVWGLHWRFRVVEGGFEWGAVPQ